MIFRPATEADLDRLLACPTDGIPGVTPDIYRADLAEGSYRFHWTWVAEDDGELVARAVWWGDADGDRPLSLDDLRSTHPDRVSVGAALLDAAHAVFGDRPDYHLFLPADWEDDGERLAAFDWRVQAAAAAGLTDRLDRLRFDWAPSVGMPAATVSTGRLTFAPEPDDAVFLALFERVAAGSLDAATRKNVARLGAAAEARQDMDKYLNMPGERSWWRVAFDAKAAGDGEVVGFAIPSRNPNNYVVGYLGVAPEHRGRGYVDELLGEITRILAGVGAERIVADTDVGNVPMARAFERARWRHFAIRVVLSAPV